MVLAVLCNNVEMKKILFPAVTFGEGSCKKLKLINLNL